MLNKVSKIVGDYLNEDTKVVKNEEVKNNEEKPKKLLFTAEEVS